MVRVSDQHQQLDACNNIALPNGNFGARGTDVYILHLCADQEEFTVGPNAQVAPLPPHTDAPSSARQLAASIVAAAGLGDPAASPPSRHTASTATSPTSQHTPRSDTSTHSSAPHMGSTQDAHAPPSGLDASSSGGGGEYRGEYSELLRRVLAARAEMQSAEAALVGSPLGQSRHLHLEGGGGGQSSPPPAAGQDFTLSTLEGFTSTVPPTAAHNAAVPGLLAQVRALEAQNRFLNRRVHDLSSQVQNMHTGVAGGVSIGSQIAIAQRHAMGSSGGGDANPSFLSSEIAAFQAGVDVLSAFGEAGFGVSSAVEPPLPAPGSAGDPITAQDQDRRSGPYIPGQQSTRKQVDDPTALDAEAASSSLLPLSEVFPLAAARAVHAQGDVFRCGIVNARGMLSLQGRTAHNLLTDGDAAVLQSGRAFRSFVSSVLGRTAWSVPANLGDIIRRALQENRTEIAGFSREDALRFAKFTSQAMSREGGSLMSKGGFGAQELHAAGHERAASSLSSAARQEHSDQNTPGRKASDMTAAGFGGGVQARGRGAFDRIQKLEREQMLDAGGITFRDFLKLYFRIPGDHLASVGPVGSATVGKPEEEQAGTAKQSARSIKHRSGRSRPSARSKGSQVDIAPHIAGRGSQLQAGPAKRNTIRSRSKNKKHDVRNTTVTGTARFLPTAQAQVGSEQVGAWLHAAREEQNPQGTADDEKVVGARQAVQPTGVLQLMRDLRKLDADSRNPRLFHPASVAAYAAVQMRTLLSRYAAALRHQTNWEHQLQVQQTATAAAESRARDAEQTAVAAEGEGEYLRQRLVQLEYALQRMTTYATSRGALLEAAEEQMRRSKGAMLKLHSLLQQYCRLPEAHDEEGDGMFEWMQ